MKNLSAFVLLFFFSLHSFSQKINSNPSSNFENGNQWDKVIIANFESEIRNLNKIDFVTVKATGATTFSSVSRVHNRALRKLKIATALLGGNVVYLKNESLEGNNRSVASRLSRSQLVGTIYSTQLPDTSTIIQQLKATKEYTLVVKVGMRNNDAGIHTFKTDFEPIYIESHHVENGYVCLELSLYKGGVKKIRLPENNKNRDKVRVIGIIDSGFIVAYKDDTSIYNLRLVKK